MRLHFGQTVPLKPGEQTDKMFTTIFTLDRGDALSRFGRNDARKLQVDFATAEKLNHLVLEIEKLKRFFCVGNLEHKPFVACVRICFWGDEKVLVALARKRRR